MDVSVFIALAFFMTTLAWGRDCSVSRQFEVKYSQVLQGVLQDPEDLALPEFGMELILRKQLVQSLKTDNQGVYSFGEVSPGKYRIRVTSNAFCTPKVECKFGKCSIKSRLKLNSKNLVTVY
jgi:hypothetical protein